MSRRSASAERRARVAVIGASTTDGARLREALAAFGVRGDRVDLYGSTGGEVVLSEYDGEARMIQEPDFEEIVGHEIIFICEEGAVVRRIAAELDPDSIVIDLLGCLPARAASRPVHVDINPDVAQRSGRGCFTVPHPLALLLAEVLVPLERGFGLEEVLAVIVRPASDFGEEGLEELREQTVRLLSFSEFPVATFGGQLAFNIIPQSRLARAEPALEAQIAAQVGELLGWGEGRAAVRLLTAPVFHGHGLQIRFRLRASAGREEVRTALGSAGFVSPPADDAPATPLEVTGDLRASLSGFSEDGLGGFWLWAVAGETASRGAVQAVRLASRIGGL